ncbi:hypothetical protein N7516_004514 [Penicillium verrucosum]|uniref:uncharacterized protein n=1 Tax=Penicillium verrucosum TaxID=60171 RepID=UPI002545208D|nr:uncharacterized protein N7516_004514 [Penicillium verrucosum]KAJ5944346.1 hypothetical protein N7516_004514 [Penicillium verrucosum]
MRPVSSWVHVAALLSAITTISQAVQLPLPVKLVHQFPAPTYLNSLYVRPNGDIYVTTVWPDASIYSVTGANTDAPTGSLVHTFDEINVVTSITEAEPGVLVFLGGNQSSIGVGVFGTFGVYEIDIRPQAKGGKASIRYAVPMPDAGLMTGIQALPLSPSTLLVSDSFLGLVYKVDTMTGKYEVAIKDEASMGHPSWTVTPFGINNLRIHNGYLYWTNSYVASVYRVAITKDGYAAPGSKIELVKRLQTIYLDSICLGPGESDTIWGATNADNRLVAITSDGNATFVAGSPTEMTIAGSVAPGFGTLPGDTETLYVATGGSLLFPVNGTVTEGGKIVAVDTTGFGSGESNPREKAQKAQPCITFSPQTTSWMDYLWQLPLRHLSLL